MNIVFWLNSLSPHQLPYITCLLDDKRVNRVICVASDDVTDKRKEMGWSISDVDENLEIKISPSTEEMQRIFQENQKESWHLFSGIRGFQTVFTAFKMSLTYDISRAIITESPYTYAFGRTNGKPLWLHKIRFYLQDYKYKRHIKKVFAIGEKAEKYFSSISAKWEVIPFAYCTKQRDITVTEHEGCLKTCFVGSLSQRKAPQLIIKACKDMNDKMKHVFIGDGPMRNKLDELIRQFSLTNFTVSGFVDNNQIPQLMNDNDVLILPSIYDGWGAVLNEALQTGLYVICSDTCGAKDLIRDIRCGQVFKANDTDDLKNKLQWCARHLEDIRKDNAYRRTFAEKTISGKVIATYMTDILHGMTPACPWRNTDY